MATLKQKWNLTFSKKLTSKVGNSAWYCNGSDDEIYDNSNESTITISNRCHLENLRLKNSKNIIFGDININSVRNEFEHLCELVASNADIILIIETELGSSFPIL